MDCNENAEPDRSSKAKLTEVLRKYGELWQEFERLGTYLKDVLQRQCREKGIHAFVSHRTKEVNSFAEKIYRPGKKYQEPLKEMTDLCGVRVIVSTLTDVERVEKEIIETPSFKILKKEKKLEKLLAENHFGYLSDHYEVSLSDKRFAPIDSELVAEIQVRTILQHAWADIYHGLGYKTGFKLPDDFQRRFHILAAILERADRDFDQLLPEMENFAKDYLVYHNRDALAQEALRLEKILQAVPDGHAEASFRLAEIALALGDWDKAVQLLEPLADTQPQSPWARVLGISLYKKHSKSSGSPEFRAGQAYLEQATQLNPTDIDALASLGGTWRTLEDAATEDSRRREYRERAKDCYRRAWFLRTDDPYSLGNNLEYLLADHPEFDILSLFLPSIQKACERCLAQIRVGLNLPWACFDLGKFQLMLGDPHLALTWYIRGVRLSTARYQPESALKSFGKLDVVKHRLAGFEWVQQWLQLVLDGKKWDRDLLPTRTDCPLELSEPVVIVAGQCGEPIPEPHRRYFFDSFLGFRGTIVSGGTTAGVGGLVGELRSQCQDGIRAIGYVPKRLPPGAVWDERYDSRRSSEGQDFTPLEALLYWRDIVANGIAIEKVRLLCLGGGQLAGHECEMAAALGAQVRIYGWKPCRVLELAEDPFWQDEKYGTDRTGLRKIGDAAEVRKWLA